MYSSLKCPARLRLENGKYILTKPHSHEDQYKEIKSMEKKFNTVHSPKFHETRLRNMNMEIPKIRPPKRVFEEFLRRFSIFKSLGISLN